MANLERPLFSDEAVGSVAKTLSFSKGIEFYYVRFPGYKKKNKTAKYLAATTKFKNTVLQWNLLDQAIRNRYCELSQRPWTGLNDYFRILNTLVFIRSIYAEVNYGHAIFGNNP